jgi:hypothetical protein
MMKKAAAAILILFLFGGCGTAPVQTTPIPSPSPPAEAPPNAGRATIAFDYQSQPGHASNQFALWIEDGDGKLVKTLYATRFTAAGGYKNRPDSILTWVQKSGLPERTEAEVDAITAATPKSGRLSYVWDLTDNGGNPVPAGTYSFVVEGTLRWKNYVLYSGSIAVGGAASSIAAEPVYHFEAGGNQAALAEDAAETGMITNVTAEYGELS